MIHVSLPEIDAPVWMLIGFLAYFVFWVWSLIAVLSDKREGKDVEKLTWVVVLILLPVLGLILYAFLGPGATTDREAEAGRKPWEAGTKESVDQEP